MKVRIASYAPTGESEIITIIVIISPPAVPAPTTGAGVGKYGCFQCGRSLGLGVSAGAGMVASCHTPAGTPEPGHPCEL